jgi:hypothetical protein
MSKIFLAIMCEKIDETLVVTISLLDLMYKKYDNIHIIILIGVIFLGDKFQLRYSPALN